MPRLNAFTNRILAGKGLTRNFVFNRIISSNIQNYNLRSDAVAAGWNGITPLAATITVNSGVYVWSDSTALPGFDTGSIFPVGTTLNIVNNGFIIGKGGTGASATNFGAANAGLPGGPAMSIGYATTIINNSYIAGGGGGGGLFIVTVNNGSIAGGGGGAGGGAGGTGMRVTTPRAGGAGGAPGQAGGNGVIGFDDGGAGGGGGRILPGARQTGRSLGGQAGGVGGNNGAGFGGGGGETGGSAASTNIFPGSGGGGWGAAGGTDPRGSGQSRAPGAGGKAINLNGNTATFTVTGTVWGAIS
jgi:hypothetical protein